MKNLEKINNQFQKVMNALAEFENDKSVTSSDKKEVAEKLEKAIEVIENKLTLKEPI